MGGANLEGISTLKADTNQMANRWSGTPVRFSVGSGVDYAAMVEFGTSSHTIEASGGGALHFTVDGTEVFAQSVDHPGTDPNPFLRDAAASVERELPSIVQGADSVADALERAAAKLERYAKVNAPVDSGRFKASIKYYRID